MVCTIDATYSTRICYIMIPASSSLSSCRRVAFIMPLSNCAMPRRRRVFESLCRHVRSYGTRTATCCIDVFCTCARSV